MEARTGTALDDDENEVGCPHSINPPSAGITNRVTTNRHPQTTSPCPFCQAQLT
jgi:hypothetical protein